MASLDESAGAWDAEETGDWGSDDNNDGWGSDVENSDDDAMLKVCSSRPRFSTRT
jgi:hypothetical protein